MKEISRAVLFLMLIVGSVTAKSQITPLNSFVEEKGPIQVYDFIMANI